MAQQETKTRFRFRYRKLGDHMHIRVFAIIDGPAVKAQNLGNLIMGEDQFKEFKAENRKFEFMDEEAPGVSR